MRFSHAELMVWCEQVLTNAAAMRTADARLLAESLLDADLRGVQTHGLTRLPIYVERMRRGVLNARPEVTVTRLGESAATVDGDEGPGQLAGWRATHEAIDLGRGSGAGVVTVSRSAHFGAASWYTAMVAEAGMIGVALTHAEADVVPFGGSRPALGTNPLSIAAPGPGGGDPLLLDMATSATAMGRVLLARQDGTRLPEGWAVDDTGRPTTDPHAARAVVPLGGPKGYGLAVFVDVLSSLLTGAPFGTDIPRMYDDLDVPQHLGHLFLVIDVTHFLPLDEFRSRMSVFGEQLTSTPPAEGFDRVRLPGQPEQERAHVGRADGIPLRSATLSGLSDLADDAGIPLPTPIDAEEVDR